MKNPTIAIIITGPQGSGKTQLAELIAQAIIDQWDLHTVRIQDSDDAHPWEIGRKAGCKLTLGHPTTFLIHAVQT